MLWQKPCFLLGIVKEVHFYIVHLFFRWTESTDLYTLNFLLVALVKE